jgi:AraC-like DNA-binding protein
VPVAKTPPIYTVSTCLTRPFMRVLAKHPTIDPGLLEQYDKEDPSKRVPLTDWIEALSAFVAITGDENLGLRAAQAISPGDFEVIEYAAVTCRNRRESLAVVFNYIALVNEAADFSLEINRDKAYIWLRSKVPLRRADNDYQVTCIYVVVDLWIGHESPQELEIWFQHPAPDDTSLYREIFKDVPVVFNAPDNAIVCEASRLDRPLPTADPKLNKLLRSYADQLLAALPRAESVTGEVRKSVLELLPERRATVEEVAKRMHVSRRTLHRQLGAEGATFKALVDELRQRLALQHLQQRKIGIDEIAIVLGFSNSPSFYRAFKRWTGKTPHEYCRVRG